MPHNDAQSGPCPRCNPIPSRPHTLKPRQIVNETTKHAQVAVQLSEKDVIRAHARDELGIDMDDLSNPWKAAGASALAFVFGAGAQ